MNRLETSYRRLLRAYPVEWREERGEEMLAVLLEWVPDHQTRPSVREAVDVIWNGLRARFFGTSRSGPQSLRERVSLMALASGAAVSLLCLIFGEIIPQLTPIYQERIMTTPLYSVAPVLYVSWLVGTGLLFAGVIRNVRRLALVLLGATGLVTVASVAAHWNIIAAPPLSLMAFMAMLAGLGLVGPTSITSGARKVLGIATLGTMAIVGYTHFLADNWGYVSGGFDFYHVALTEWLRNCTWAVAAGLVLGGAVASIRRPGWLLASVLASVPWICYTVAFPDYYGPELFPAAAVLVGVGALGLLVRDAVRASQPPRGAPLS